MAAGFVIERQGQFHIVRDDLLHGGTKRRALDLMLGDVAQKDCVYAGTIFGHGALALSLACRDHGKRAHLFLSANAAAHPMLSYLRSADAVIHAAEALPVATLWQKAQAWAGQNEAHIFQPGFDEPGFITAMTHAMSGFDPAPYPEIWCASVSGTFARALQSSFPQSLIKTVSVVAGQAGAYAAREKYHQPAKLPPPYPSCPYTDAKVWQIARDHAAPGALIWNIAG